MKILSDTNQQTKLVKISGDTIGHQSKLSDPTVELDCPTMDNKLNKKDPQVAGINSNLISMVLVLLCSCSFVIS